MAKLLIDGVEYEFSMDFTIGEARILKRYTKLDLNEIENANPTNPDLNAAFIHIAFSRRNPEVAFEEIEKRVDKVKLAKIDMREDDEVDLRPPAPTPSGNAASASTSGESSGNGADSSPENVSREISGHPA